MAAPAIDCSEFAHLYPFRSNFIDRQGLAYHYLDEGRGEPLVMVHGNPTWSFYFRKLVAAFKQSHRVIVPDHMGCGLSDKPAPEQYGFRLSDRVADLAALLDALIPDQPVTLVVHDWGGMIALAWALNHPTRVRRMVLTNTAGFFPPAKKSIPLRLKVIRKANPIMDLMVLRFNLFARAAIHMAPKHRLAPAVKTGLLAPYNQPLHRWATLKFVQDIPLCPDDPSGKIVARVSARLEEICNCPVLLLWGAYDFVFDPDYFHEWRRRVPDAEAHFFKHAGHYLFEDAPGPCINHIKDFLRNHP